MTKKYITIIKPESIYFNQTCELLKSHNLPVSDLSSPLVRLWGILIEGEIVATIGAEVYSEVVMLRSLAVRPSYQRKGLAGELCKRVFRLAREEKVSAIFLLTETASDYFRRLGFRDTSRRNAPKQIQNTRQFSHLCSESAQLMMKNL